MTERKVRGYFLESAWSFIASELDPQLRERVLEKISSENRKLMEQAKPTEWYPLEVAVDILEALRACYPNEAAARQGLVRYGIIVGEGAAGTFMRLFMKMVTVQLLFKQWPALWTKYMSFGDFRNESFEPGRFVFSVSDVGGWTFAPLIGEGWTRFMMEAMKKKNVVVKTDPESGLLRDETSIRWEVRYQD